MNLALAQIALIFLPGILWSNLEAKYVSGVQTTQFNIALKSFLFGISTYGILYVVYSILGFDFSYQEITANSDTPDLISFVDEILLSIPLSLILAVAWMYLQNYRLLMKLLHWIKATKRFGDQDVWTFTLNSGQPHVEYASLRDIDNGFTFSGWINAFSEKEDIREILLEDAIIFNNEGDEVGRVPHLYLSRPKAYIWLEFPYLDQGSGEHGNEQATRETSD